MKRSTAAGELRPYVVGWLGQQARLEPAGDLTLAPTGRVVLAPGARAVVPETAMTTSLGTAGLPFLAVHAAELNVASLVAREVISTIGGRILVGPTTTLTANLAPAETTIWTRHNELAFGDILLLEAHGQIEYMRVIGGPSGSGPYTYSVQRNLDGSDANTWYAGDAVFNTGQINDGFIDIYSEHGTKSSDQAGPTIAGNVRNSTAWNDYETRWAIGNLRGLYGYTEDVYGQASGRHSAVWQATDPANGFRIMHGTTRAFAVSPDGVARLGLAGQGEIEIDPVSGALSFLSEGEVVSAILGRERTIYGFERLGRPLGPCVEWGPLADPDGDEQLERWGFWLRAQEGERFLAAVSGTETNPDDAYFRVGRDAAAHFWQLKDGLLSWAGENTSLGEDGTFTARNAVLEGSITAATGSIAGWSITADQLRGAGGVVVLDSDGIITVNNQAGLHGTHATWRIWAGESLANIASAPFRVDKDGYCYATRFVTLEADSANDTTIYARNTKNAIGAYAVHGYHTGTGSGVYGASGSGAGVYGVTSGASSGVLGQAANASAAGVSGTCSSGGVGVRGTGTGTGSYGGKFSGVAAAVFIDSGVLDMNAKNIENVNRVYFDASHYLYLSGNDIYWYDGTSGVKLN